MQLGLIAVLAALALSFGASTALAHSGGLNSEGCHNNRKSGGYHCHRSQTRSTPIPNISRDGDAYYPNCAAARAAGVAPIFRGQPGYRGRLDRDNDGVACE